jgi:uncharacterized protein (DUF1810 family)
VSDLDRFVTAQAPVIDRVLAELRAGRKETHWMWFVFPQLAGLGWSDMAQLYAIADLEEAQRYLAHPLLGPRLVQCTAIVNALAGRTAHDIFGSPDDLKFRSSMTLFGAAATAEPAFQTAITRFFDGVADARTLALLRGRAA